MTSPLPSLMHGVHITKYGPSNKVLEYKTDLAVPKIKSPHQVLVRVKAAGVNPVEAKVTAGNAKLVSSAMLSFPSVIGADFSGVIADKGKGVSEFEIGDEVFGSLPFPFGHEGSYAQYTLVDLKQASIAKKPAHLSFEQAASTGIALLTAYQAVWKNANITDKNRAQKRSFLIVGASGGIGSYGVQVAKAIHSENNVVAICSTKNAEFVKSLGADTVIDYKNEEYKTFIQSQKGVFDLVFDCVGGDDYYQQLSPLLKKKGVYSTAVGPIEHAGAKPIPLLTGIGLLSKLLYRRLFASHTYAMVFHLPHADFKTKIAPLMEKDIKGTVVGEESVIPLKDVYKAHEKLLSHRVVGKIVLSVE